jgi:uncharacterized PurR-regulated membrane protein YhhQ (DUF165 family)
MNGDTRVLFLSFYSTLICLFMMSCLCWNKEGREAIYIEDAHYSNLSNTLVPNFHT